VPLHAAGRHDGTGRSVLDQFTSSYTPTLRLLLHARADASPVSRGGPPLIVALPETPGQPPLPGAAVEADDFIRQFSSACQLRGADATVDAVRRLLRYSPLLAHFACHGTQDVIEPSAGRLLFHDGPLSITEIAALRLDAAELAYLSACQTSTGSIQLSDEAITLATAFRLAGYRHVIGTLWNISDRHAPNVARQVYQQLTHSETGGIQLDGASAALDHAVVALRKRRPTEPWLWASYIHVGP
jgi:CHAT domain-containing protein